MARTRKSIQPLDLRKYDVLIEDRAIRSDYFKITQFDGYFYGGRNAFLIAGAPVLNPNSKVLVEILNVNGDTVYSAPIANFVEGNSRLIQVEVYNDTPIGPGKIIVLGSAQTYLDGTPVPSEWADKFNVRWITDVIISPLINNKTPIRFINDPSIDVDEKFYPVPATASFSQSVAVEFGDYELSPINYNIFQNGYLIKLKNPTDSNTFKSEHLNGLFITSTSIKDNSEFISGSLPITKIFNSTAAETRGQFLSGSRQTKILQASISGSGSNYVTRIEPYGIVTASASINKIQFNKIIESPNTGSEASFAKIRITNLNTISGEINKVRVYYKIATEPGDFTLLADVPTQVEELLSIDSGSKILNVGSFQDVKISDYWYASTMSLSRNQTEPVLPNYYYSSSINTNLIVSSSSDILLDSIFVRPEIDNFTYKDSVSYFIGSTNNNKIELFPNSEYTLKFTANFRRISESISLNQSDYSMEVYLISQETSTGTLLEKNSRGQLLGTLTPVGTQQLFENIQLNFRPKINKTGMFGLRFVVYGGFWNIASLSVKVAEEPLFSPDEVAFLVPTVNLSNKLLTFKTEFLDIDNNSSDVSAVSIPVFFTGSSDYVKKSGDYITGELYIIGNQTITGSLRMLGGITGSLFGTSSLAISSSLAVTASYIAPSGLPAGVVSSSGQVDHNATTNYLPNQHIDHTSVSIIAGNGLVGGGTIAASRTLTALYIPSTDARSVNNPPATASAGLYADFKTNTTDGLVDGGTYHGVLTFRPYGTTSDFSGGPAYQKGFTENGNLYLRSGSLNTWSSWRKLAYETGSLLGTASFASTASVAISASWAPDAGLTGGTTNYIPLWTGTGTLSSSAMFQNVGNVGIGTINPKTRFNVNSGWLNTISPSPAGTADSASVYFTNLDANYGILMGVLGSGTSWIQSQRTDSTATTYPLLLNPNGGNIGIGTTSPDAKLQVVGTTYLGDDGAYVPVGSPKVVVYGGTASEVSTLWFEAGIGSALAGFKASDSNFYITNTYAGNALGTNGITIGSAGDVVINGTSTQAKLTVFTGNDPAIDYGFSVGKYPRQLVMGYHTASNYGFIISTETGVGYRPLALQQFGGNVGIGTTTPNSVLDISGRLTISGSTGITHGLIMQRSGWNSNFRLGAISASGDDFWITNNWNPQTNAQDSSEAGYITLAPKNELRSVINGTRMTTLNSTGLGIGTINPVAKLHVAGNNFFYTNTDFVQSSAGSGFILSMGASSGNTYAQMYGFQAGNTQYSNLIIPGGNVGIGTVNPAYTLDVNGIYAINNRAFATGSATYNMLYRPDGGISIYLGASDAGNYYDNSLHYFRDRSSNIRMFIDAVTTGNVGIGTTTPQTRLDVSGLGGIRHASGSVTASLRANPTTNAVEFGAETFNVVNMLINGSSLYQFGIGSFVTTNPAYTLGTSINPWATVYASAYSSSISNAVGYFGTASFAVSASWAPTPSQTTSYPPSLNIYIAQTFGGF